MVSHSSLCSGFDDLYRDRGDQPIDEGGKDLQELLKPVFEGIAKFLWSSASYYRRLDLPTQDLQDL